MSVIRSQGQPAPSPPLKGPRAYVEALEAARRQRGRLSANGRWLGRDGAIETLAVDFLRTDIESLGHDLDARQPAPDMAALLGHLATALAEYAAAYSRRANPATAPEQAA